MVRHATQWLAARDLVKKGKIGDVRAIQVMFSYFNRDPNNVRNMADIGGGGLLDIGCYPITVSRFIFDAEPDARHRHLRPRPEVQDRPRWPAGWPISARAGTCPSPSRRSSPPISASTSWAPRAGSRSRSPSTRRPTGPTAISCRAWR